MILLVHIWADKEAHKKVMLGCLCPLLVTLGI